MTQSRSVKEAVIAPMAFRLVYGLYYPAILGANLILLFRQAGLGWELLSWADLPVRLAWLLTLILFICDFVGTANDDLTRAPSGNTSLFLIDGIAATVFFYAQTKLLGLGEDRLVATVEWENLWFALAALHVLYVAWYVIRISTKRSAFPDNDPRIDRYSEYWQRLLLVVVFQLLLFGFISWAIWEPREWAYVSLCLLAIIFWVGRQAVEYKHREYLDR